MFFELLGRAGAIGVTYLEDLIRLPTARGAPHYSKLRLTDRLPRRPGVYLFRNGGGEVIYIGKAKELRIEGSQLLLRRSEEADHPDDA